MVKATEVLENRNVILNYPIKLEEEGCILFTTPESKTVEIKANS